MKNILILFISILFSSLLTAQTVSSIYLLKNGVACHIPTLGLNDMDVITLKFDLLGDVDIQLGYRLEHCDRDGEVSNLTVNEVFDGFNSFEIYDFDYSRTIEQQYSNYIIDLPNDDISFKLSGRYRLDIINEDDGSILFSKDIYVVDDQVDIESTIRRSIFEGDLGTKQQLSVAVSYDTHLGIDPYNDVESQVIRNGDPLSKRELIAKKAYKGEIIYDDRDVNLFEGGNEFRQFDIRDDDIASYGVAAKRYFKGEGYAIALRPDNLRSHQIYNYYRDQEGLYTVATLKDNRDPDLDAEYVNTYFQLNCKQRVSEDDIYIYGGLTNWSLSEANKLKWDSEKQCYWGVLLLKQGVYDYQYIYSDSSDRSIFNVIDYEGSFYQTRNVYDILIFKRSIGERYDQLIGYESVTSGI